MSSVRVLSYWHLPIKSLNIVYRELSTTSIFCSTRDWRIKNGYPARWTDRGILTDGLDFSYVNGKASPYTNGQRKRLLQHKIHAEKILYLLKAVVFAKTTHHERYQRIEEMNQAIVAKKLKPKGNLLKKKLTA